MSKQKVQNTNNNIQSKSAFACFSVLLKFLTTTLLFVFILFAGQNVYGALCESNTSGNWNDPSIWSCGIVPSPGDNVVINSGHTVTYSGNLNWNDGSIGGNGHFITDGNLTISSNGSIASWDNLDITTTGNFNYEKGGFIIGTGKEFNIGGTCTINGDLTINEGFLYIDNDLLLPNSNITFYNNGVLNVGGEVDKASTINLSQGSMDARGDVFAADLYVHQTSSLAVGGTLELDNNATITSSGVLDIDGSFSANNLTLEDLSIAVIEGDINLSNNLTANSNADLVIAGSYDVSGTTTINNNGEIFVFGNITCSSGDCLVIEDLDNWLSETPGLPYLSSVTAEITTTGSGSINISEDAMIVVECWGAGGSGADIDNNNTQGGGGGGGAYASSILNLTAGSYNYYVGAGSSTSIAGEDTWFQSTTSVMAKGGNSVPINTITGAVGGLELESYGDTKFSGGNGASGTGGGTKVGGGGGSSAGTSSDGNNGSGITGGGAPTGGGAGGNGGAEGSDGFNGGYPGGGGGGASRKNSGILTGGSGADGKIKITISTSPLVFFTSASTTQTEDAVTLSIDINMTTTSSSLVSIPFSISGTAIGGDVDYTLNTSSPIEITAGNTTQSISITIIQDTEYEPDETIIIQLGTPTNASLGSPDTHSITIENDDPEPNLTLSVTPSSICIGETFTLSTTGVNCNQVDSYEYSTDDGTTWNYVLNNARTCTTTHQPATTGVYQYRAYSSKNGVGFSNIVTVPVIPLPQGDLTANGPFCESSTGQLTWTASEGTDPCTVIYNDGTTDYTVTDVYSGTPFDVENNPVSATTTYTLQSVTDINGCSRSSGFSTASATIVIQPLSSTVTQYTPDNECPQLDPALGFEPNNDGPYDAGSSEIQFQIQNNSPTTDWNFTFDISDANGTTGFLVDSVNAAGNDSYNQDILNSNGTFSSIPVADDLITITTRVKNIPGSQLEIDFNLSNITDTNGCSTSYTENRDTVIMNVMPVVGSFE
jgi:hypothetical protein